MQFRHERTDAPSKSCVIPFSLMLSNRWRNIPNCHSVYFKEKNHYYIEILMEVLTTYQLKMPAKYRENIVSFTNWERVKSKTWSHPASYNTANNFTFDGQVRPDWDFANRWSGKEQQSELCCIVCNHLGKLGKWRVIYTWPFAHSRNLWPRTVLGKCVPLEVGYPRAGKD